MHRHAVPRPRAIKNIAGDNKYEQIAATRLKMNLVADGLKQNKLGKTVNNADGLNQIRAADGVRELDGLFSSRDGGDFSRAISLRVDLRVKLPGRSNQRSKMRLGTWQDRVRGLNAHKLVEHDIEWAQMMSNIFKGLLTSLVLHVFAKDRGANAERLVHLQRKRHFLN